MFKKRNQQNDLRSPSWLSGFSFPYLLVVYLVHKKRLYIKQILTLFVIAILSK